MQQNLYDKHLLLIKDKSYLRLDRISASNYPRDNFIRIEIVLNMAEMVITGHRSMIQSLNHYLILLIWYMYITILQFQKKNQKLLTFLYYNITLLSVDM